MPGFGPFERTLLPFGFYTYSGCMRSFLGAGSGDIVGTPRLVQLCGRKESLMGNASGAAGCCLPGALRSGWERPLHRGVLSWRWNLNHGVRFKLTLLIFPLQVPEQEVRWADCFCRRERR